jgi:hypothetical protein
MIGIALAAVLLSSPLVTAVEGGKVFLDEQFESITRWRPLFFPKIEAHSTYSVTTLGSVSALKIISDNSASALVLKKKFNVYDFPNIAWRWQVSNVFIKGDSSRKDGDDYPVRLYVMFEYNPDKASFGQSVKYGMAKLLYGDYPPHSSLNYIWANKIISAPFIPNPFTSQAMMIPVDKGGEKAGGWMEHQADIIRDYRTAFGENPPAMASIAVMGDSDNTGESATAFIDYIKIYARERNNGNSLSERDR